MNFCKLLKHIVVLFIWLSLANFSFAESLVSKAGIALDEKWKVTVYQFSKDNLQHTAWGVSHYERNYLLAKELAQLENVEIDEDVLFAAAFLHDIGVFEPYVIEGAEHSKTAADNVESILKPTGFPMEKLSEVKGAILSHMFYAEVSENNTARVLHDADTLDFLGSIGIARILSLTTRHGWASDLATGIETLKKFNQDLPSKLVFENSRRLAAERLEESSLFIESLNKESSAGLAL